METFDVPQDERRTRHRHEKTIPISFRGEDGTFEKSKNLGPPINTEGHELCPYISRDGRYFYYTSVLLRKFHVKT